MHTHLFIKSIIDKETRNHVTIFLIPELGQAQSISKPMLSQGGTGRWLAGQKGVLLGDQSGEEGNSRERDR